MIRGHVDEFLFFFWFQKHSSSVFILICTLWHGAGGSFWKHGGKRKRKGFLGLFCGIGERSPHTHDMNMEGRERTWRERRKGKNKGEERKGNMPRLSSLLPSWRRYVRYMYVYLFLYLKSRNHDLLKELKELDGNHSIIEGASLMTSAMNGTQLVFLLRFGSVKLPRLPW